MEFFDRVVPGKVRTTADGYIVAEAPVARTGIQLYRGDELGVEKPFVRVYRPESEVFAQDSMHSYAHRPMTNDHPPVLVDSQNWSDFAIGQTGDEIVRDGDHVRVPLVLMDAAAIADFKAGKRELSMGYTADMEFFDEEQQTEDGMKYDAIQKNLRMNHLALVHRGRAGSAKIGDGRNPEHASDNKGGHTMPDLKKVMVDGLSVETTEAGAQAIAKLQSDLADAQKQCADANTAHQEAIAAKDTELATKDAEIEKLKGNVLSDEQMAAAVAARSELVSTAQRVHADADYTKLSSDDIRKTAVAGVLGDEAVADKSQAYIDARFDVLVEGLSEAPKPKDPVRGALADGNGNEGEAPDADKAYDGYLDHLTTAHRA